MPIPQLPSVEFVVANATKAVEKPNPDILFACLRPFDNWSKEFALPPSLDAVDWHELKRSLETELQQLHEKNLIEGGFFEDLKKSFIKCAETPDLIELTKSIEQDPTDLMWLCLLMLEYRKDLDVNETATETWRQARVTELLGLDISEQTELNDLRQRLSQKDELDAELKRTEVELEKQRERLELIDKIKCGLSELESLAKSCVCDESSSSVCDESLAENDELCKVEKRVKETRERALENVRIDILRCVDLLDLTENSDLRFQLLKLFEEDKQPAHNNPVPKLPPPPIIKEKVITTNNAITKKLLLIDSNTSARENLRKSLAWFN